MRQGLRVAIAAFIVSTIGCGRSATMVVVPAKPATNASVAFVTNNPDPFWTIVEMGCKKAEAETGVQLIFKKPSSGNPAEQKEIIDSLVTQGVSAIAVSVIDPDNQVADINRVAAKVPFLAVDNDAPQSHRKCYIGTDNYKAGRAAGQLVKQVLPEGGVVALFVGQTEALNARQRCQGVLDELAGEANLLDANRVPPLPKGEATYGKYKLHRIYTDQPEGEPACKQKATDALIQLDKEPNVCFVGLWAYNPPAILSAVKDQNKLGKVKIVGFDENPATLAGIEDGHISGTIVQDPFNFGYEAVKAMAQIVQGAGSGQNQHVPHRVVAKTGGNGQLTVQQYKEQELKKIAK